MSEAREITPFLVETEIQLERVLIGSAIVFGNSWHMPPKITPAHFADPQCNVVCRALRSLEAKGERIDGNTIQDELFKTEIGLSNGLMQAGGVEGLIELCNDVIPPSGLDYYVGKIESQYARRKARELASRLNQLAGKPEFTVADVAALLNQGALDVASASKAPIFTMDQIDHEGNDAGVTTGFRRIDGLIETNGYPAGQVSVVSAYHKGGKSAFMIASAIRCAKAGYKVHYATFADLMGKHIKGRMMRMLCGWSKRPDNLMLQEAYDGSLRWLNARGPEIYDVTGADSGYSVDVEGYVAWLRAVQPVRKYDLVFVDYAQKLTSCDRKASNPYEEANICSRVLNYAAGQLGIPIIVGSQISEGMNGEKTKTKGSRNWEEDAGWVLRLKRDDDQTIVESAYSRFGDPGEVLMRFNHERRVLEDDAPPVAQKGDEYDPWSDE